MSDVSTTSSGMTGAGGGNMLRITGMATGLDVDSMVKKMMAAEQTKLDKAKQNQQTIQWKQEAYQDIINDIKGLQSSFFDSMSSDKNILSSTNFSPFTVNGVNGGTVDTSVATLTPGVGAQTGTYNITFTDPATNSTNGQHLASAAAVSGSSDSLNATTSGFAQSNWNGKTIGFSIDGGTDQAINLTDLSSDPLKNTINDTVDDINTQISNNTSLNGKVKAVASNGKIQFQALTDSTVKISNSTTATTPGKTTVSTDMDNLTGEVINISTATTMGDLGLTGINNKITFTYNNTTYDVPVSTTDKISDVINNISSKTSGKVIGKFSQLTGNFTIQTASTGDTQNLTLTATNAATALGLTDTTAKQGQDAILFIKPPGATDYTKVTKSNNNFTIDGMTYSISSVGNASVTVGTDTQKVYDKIKDFIDKYNTVMDKIQTKLSEKKSSDYKPLTDSQKESMSASQITAWETKAKVGILRNDNNLQSMLNSLRTAFTSAVDGANGVSFAKYGDNSIGIDMSSEPTTPGHIEITDASKLKDAIASKGDQILKLFTNQSTKTLATSETYDINSGKYKEDGIFTRVKAILQSNVGYTNTTLNSAILTSYANKQYDYSTSGTAGKGTIPDQIYEQQLMVKKITDSMSTKQEQYYQKFSQLESAMTTLNAQQAQLSQLSG